MFNLNFKRFVRTIPILWLVGPEGGQMEKRPESVRASWQALAFTVHISDRPFISFCPCLSTLHITLPLPFYLSYHFAFVFPPCRLCKSPEFITLTSLIRSSWTNGLFINCTTILCHQDRKSKYQRKKSSCRTTKSHLICPLFYSHGKVARNVNCEIEFASSVTLGAGCESVTVASCESETEAKCKLIRCRLRSERSRRQNPALRNSGKQCQGHNSHTTLWIAQDQPHIPFWPIGHY